VLLRKAQDTTGMPSHRRERESRSLTVTPRRLRCSEWLAAQAAAGRHVEQPGAETIGLISNAISAAGFNAHVSRTADRVARRRTASALQQSRQRAPSSLRLDLVAVRTLRSRPASPVRSCLPCREAAPALANPRSGCRTAQSGMGASARLNAQSTRRLPSRKLHQPHEPWERQCSRLEAGGHATCPTALGHVPWHPGIGLARQHCPRYKWSRLRWRGQL